MTLDQVRDLCLQEFPQVVISAEVVQRDRTLRCTLADGSHLDIFSGRTGRYSYHWQCGDGAYRFNNAPHFDYVETAPHHFHEPSGRVESSPITGVSEEDVRKVLQFIHERLAR